MQNHRAAGEWLSNFQIQVVLQPEPAPDLVAHLKRDILQSYGMITHVSDVRVMRAQAFCRRDRPRVMRHQE
jgi:hypothetical protein